MVFIVRAWLKWELGIKKGSRGTIAFTIGVE